MKELFQFLFLQNLFKHYPRTYAIIMWMSNEINNLIFVIKGQGRTSVEDGWILISLIEVLSVNLIIYIEKFWTIFPMKFLGSLFFPALLSEISEERDFWRYFKSFEKVMFLIEKHVQIFHLWFVSFYLHMKIVSL